MRIKIKTLLELMEVSIGNSYNGGLIFANGWIFSKSMFKYCGQTVDAIKRDVGYITSGHGYIILDSWCSEVDDWDEYKLSIKPWVFTGIRVDQELDQAQARIAAIADLRTDGPGKELAKAEAKIKQLKTEIAKYEVKDLVQGQDCSYFESTLETKRKQILRFTHSSLFARLKMAWRGEL